MQALYLMQSAVLSERLDSLASYVPSGGPRCTAPSRSRPRLAAPVLAETAVVTDGTDSFFGSRTVFQLQRRQYVWHQITREQHSLNQPLRQRLVRGEGGLGSARVFGESLAPSDGDFQELRVRELGETRRQPRGDLRHWPDRKSVV